MPPGSSGLGCSSSTAHLPTPARLRARAPGPVPGRLYAATGGGTGHLAALSRRLSATGIRFLGILSRRGFRPSYDRPTAPLARTPAGFPCSARVRPSWDGRPLYPGGGGVHTTVARSTAAACRFSTTSPCHPGTTTRPRGARINGTSSRVHWYSPVQPSPHLWPRGRTGALGLPLKLRTPASRTRRRTSMVGTGLEHRPEVTPPASPDLHRRTYSQRATSRRNLAARLSRSRPPGQGRPGRPSLRADP